MLPCCRLRRQSVIGMMMRAHLTCRHMFCKFGEDEIGDRVPSDRGDVRAEEIRPGIHKNRLATSGTVSMHPLFPWRGTPHPETIFHAPIIQYEAGFLRIKGPVFVSADACFSTFGTERNEIKWARINKHIVRFFNEEVTLRGAKLELALINLNVQVLSNWVVFGCFRDLQD